MKKFHNSYVDNHMISATAEARVVELPLQYPDSQLVCIFRILKQEGIDISFPSVFHILRRHGLENREKRLARSQVKRAVQEIIAQTERKSNGNPLQEGKIPPPHVLPVKRVHPFMNRRDSWGLTAFNIALLIVIAFSVFYIVQNTQSAFQEPQTRAETIPEPLTLSLATVKKATLPLNDYRMIWKQNLFGISEEKASARKKNEAQRDLPLVKKDIGLKLVGTVVSDDPTLNRALIENLIARTQGIYSVGNRIEHVLIKKILNDRVIVNAGRGDEILLMRNPLIAATHSRGDNGSVARTSNKNHRSGHRHRTVTLSREAVESALSNIDRALNNVYISSGLPFNNPPGFRITSFERDSIFALLGLRNGDRILSINDQKMNGAEQAKAFFSKIREGGSLDVTVKRRARTRHIHLNIK